MFYHWGKVLGIFVLVFFLLFSFNTFPHSIKPGNKVEKSNLVNQKPNNQKIRVKPDFGKIPLYFIPNKGQIDHKVFYYARTPRFTLWITKEGLIFDEVKKERQPEDQKNILNKLDASSKFKRDISRLIFINGNKNCRMTSVDESEYKVNYLVGNDKSKWRTDIRTFKAVLYKNIYPNIDLKVYGVEETIEYDWIIKPGGNPEDIQFKYEDVKKTKIDKKGNIEAETGFGKIIHKKPYSFQTYDNKKNQVKVKFEKIKENSYTFFIQGYDNKRNLIIDPLVLNYSTFLGGNDDDFGTDIAVDSNNIAYITGYTKSTDFPTQNAYQNTKDVSDDIFITKLSSSGSSLEYSTFLGGDSDDIGMGIVLDSSHNIYITGYTKSTDFPTQNAYTGSLQGTWDSFISKLSSTGTSLEYSTYLGGSTDDMGVDIAVDSNNNAYITGYTKSADFPTQNAYDTSLQGTWDSFVTKLSSTGSSLEYSTYLGGSDSDQALGIEVDSSHCAYISGTTYSTDFPTQNAYQDTNQGGAPGVGPCDVFLTKLSSTGGSLEYSTYLGGSYPDEARDIDIDGDHCAYITGVTYSTDFPTQNAYQSSQPTGTCTGSVFVTKFASTGSSLEYSTYIGGSEVDVVDIGYGIAVDSSECAYVTGYTNSTTYPTQDPYMTDPGDSNQDGFITKLSSSGSSLLYSSYIGGNKQDVSYNVAVDSLGNAYITGYTASTNYPTQNAYEDTFQGAGDYHDAFVTKFTFSSGTEGSISGHVIDENGDGIYQIYVYIYDLSNNKVGTAITDTSGNYQEDYLSPGNYKIYFYSNGNYVEEWYNNKSDFAGADEVSVIGGQTTSGINAQLSDGGIVSGKITDASGSGIYHVRVDAYDLGNNLIETGWTDLSGDYDVVGLPSDDYKIYFNNQAVPDYSDEWYDDKLDFSSADIIGVTAGSTTSGIDAELSGPVLSLNRDSLIYGTDSINLTKSQDFLVSNDGTGSISYTISDNMDWLECSPTSGTGTTKVTCTANADGKDTGTYNGIVTVTDTDVANSPQTIAVTLNVYSSGATSSPFGSFDTPVSDSTVRSSVPVSGWVLDDIEVESVKIYREPLPGEPTQPNGYVYIGDATFVEGARPDVESAHPHYPLNYRAGWGYMLLTYGLPNKGMNDTFTLHAIATDKEGNTAYLGTKTITCDNQNAVKPFGAIDIPKQGGEASGSSYLNWGWALTPDPNMIPIDGSTIDVVVDGVVLGNPVYNNYREDIATRYSEYSNSDGAIGYYYIDTTPYDNGRHTISWRVEDDAGNTDGMGSRFFNIVNTGSGSSEQEMRSSGMVIIGEVKELNRYIEDIEPVRVKRGYSDEYGQVEYPNADRERLVEIEEVERVVIELAPDRENTDYRGYMIVGDGLRKLPIGSTLNKEKGVFYWIPGPGFLGEYNLVFIDSRNQTKKNVKVVIVPKTY